jgi:two-component system, OmpR family, phosphate regulon sensor histidine kinase PhoR
MKKKLFWRIFAGLALVSVLGVGILAAYSQRALRAASVDSLTERLRGVALAARAASSGLLPEGRSASLADLARRLARETGTRLTLVDGRGVVLADSEQDPQTMENHASRPEVAQALGGSTGVATRYSSTLGAWTVYVAVPFRLADGRPGAVRASAPRAALDAAVGQEGGRLALFASVLLAACLLAALAVSRTIAAPLRDLTGVVKRFASGDFGARLHLRRRDEVRDLAESFNSMGERIQALFRENSERTRQLDGIFSSVRQGIVLLDRDDRIVRANRGFEDLAGAAPGPGRTLLEAMAVPRLSQLVHAARGSGARQVEEINVGGRTVLCSVELMEGQEQLIVLLSDTTEIHRLETLKRDFVANASHELRTPLTTIGGSLEMLEENAGGPEAGRWIEAIRRNASRMSAIVEDLLLLSRLEATGVEPVREALDLASIVREVAALFGQKAAQRGVGLRVEAAPSLPSVIGDPFLVEQMLVNLVDNALKYTEKGEVVVSCAAEAEGTDRIDISDTGIGIPAEHLCRIFERFYVVDPSRSRRMGGTGLGLAIVKHIVQAHGGTIQVESEPGRGTRFTIRLPAGRDQRPNSPETHTTLNRT